MTPRTAPDPAAGSIGSVLRIRSAGRDWGVPLASIERVSRPDEVRLDLHGPRPVLHTERLGGGEAPLESLSPWGLGEQQLVGPGQRLLLLKSQRGPLGILVDEVLERSSGDDLLQPLPDLPFLDRPPIAGLLGRGEASLPVIDVARLAGVSEHEAPAPPTDEAIAAVEIDSARAARDGDLALMLLPEIERSSGPLVPALSARQVLGFESASTVLALPSLPAWCTGVGWWRGEPLAVLDLRRRLTDRQGVKHHARRWLIAAVPGGPRVALEVDGPCRPNPMPSQARVIPAREPLSQAIHGLFQVGEKHLALLDLARWCRTPPRQKPPVPPPPGVRAQPAG